MAWKKTWKHLGVFFGLNFCNSVYLFFDVFKRFTDWTLFVAFFHKVNGDSWIIFEDRLRKLSCFSIANHLKIFTFSMSSDSSLSKLELLDSESLLNWNWDMISRKLEASNSEFSPWSWLQINHCLHFMKSRVPQLFWI